MKKLLLLVFLMITYLPYSQSKDRNTVMKKYFKEKYNLERSFGERISYSYYANLEEEEFIAESKLLRDKRISILTKYEKLLDNEDYLKEKNDIEFKYLNRIYYYQGLRRMMTGNQDFKVSNKYPKVFERVNLEDDFLLKSEEYIYFVSNYIKSIEKNKNVKYDSIDFELCILKTLDATIKNPNIKEQVVYQISINENAIQRTKELNNYYNLAKKLLLKEEYISLLNNRYEKLKLISKGARSPDFELVDIHGKTYTLKDFKGRYVYIDVWATWCLPCVKEIPLLKEIEKEYKNIQFVSICMNDSMGSWESMVNQKDLGGIQLFAPDSNNDFFKTLMIKSIPRHILIDKEGRIVNAFELHPSKHLRRVLDSLD